MDIIGSDPMAIAFLKQHLRSELEMKDLGFFRYFLGIEVVSSSHDYLLSQQKYIAELLDRATLSDHVVTTTFSLVFTPMELHFKLRRNDGIPLLQHTQYMELVSSLIYLSATRPDISRAVYVLNQFVNAPTLAQYAVLLRVLRYL